jgi:hypothetical protein
MVKIERSKEWWMKKAELEATPDRAALVRKVARAMCGCFCDTPCGVGAHYATVALDLIRAETLEEAARVVPTTWLDPLLTGPGATELPLDGPGVEKLCRGIAAAIRAMKGTP